VRQHDALWGNARGFQGFQDLPGSSTEFEVAGNRDVCASVRLAGSLENTMFEGRDAPVPCADLYDARANPRRLLPRAGVVCAFAPFHDVPYEELGKFIWRGPVHPMLRRVMRFSVYASSQHYV
jgi:hypothetical protein